MKSAPVVGALVAAGVAAVLVATTAPEIATKGPQGAAVKPVKESKQVRPALLAECPDLDEPGQPCQAVRKTDQGCICITTSEVELAGEQTEQPGVHKGLWVCPEDAEHPGTWTTWRKSQGTPYPGCRLVIPPSRFAGHSMRGVDLGHAFYLSKRCKPCDVRPGAWGPCPACWLDGDCAEQCAPPPEPDPDGGVDAGLEVEP